MYFNILVSRLKCLFRNPCFIFWTLAFPIILGTFFHFAFAGFDDDYKFKPIDIAVVKSDSLNNDATFKTTIDNLSGDDSSETQLFNTTYCTQEEADTLLKDSKIKGYFEFTTEPILTLKGIGTEENGDLGFADIGMEESTLKSFLDQYNQTSYTYTELFKLNPQKAQEVITSNIDTSDFLKETPISNTKPDLTLTYFYALIAMACLFGSSSGLNEIKYLQANQSSQAARLSIAPTKKSVVFFASLSAATLLQILCSFILILFLMFVLKVDFGSRIPYVFLGSAVGSLTGVLMGSFIGVILKCSSHLKTSICISVSLFFSFLSGLMIVNMKQIIQANAPIVAALNPANAITDTFYSLYFYDDLTRYFNNLLGLLGFSLFFFVVVFTVMRRQRYDSI